MKRNLTYLLLACTISPSVFGLINLGEGKIDFNLSASSYYDTAIRSRNATGGEEDFVFSIRPSLLYTRESRKFDISASVGVNSVTYVDFSEFNDTDVFLELDISPSARMETSRFVFSGDLILNSETRAEESIGEIITIRNYGVSANMVYDPNRSVTVTGGISYKKEDPDSEIFFERENIGASITVGTPLSKSVDLEGVIGYQDTTSEGESSNGTTLTYSAGFSGNLLPKVKGSLHAGLQDRSYDSREDDTTPYFSANLEWLVDERTSVTLTGSQSIGTTFDDRSSETLNLQLSGSRQMSRDLSGSLFIRYTDETFEGSGLLDNRTDHGPAIGGSLTYRLVRYGSIGVDFSYQDRSSTLEEFDYDRLRTGVFFKASW